MRLFFTGHSHSHTAFCQLAKHTHLHVCGIFVGRQSCRLQLKMQTCRGQLDCIKSVLEDEVRVTSKQRETESGTSRVTHGALKPNQRQKNEPDVH